MMSLRYASQIMSLHPAIQTMSFRSESGASRRGQIKAILLRQCCPLENKSSEISCEAAEGIARGQYPQITPSSDSIMWRPFRLVSLFC